MAWIRNKRQLVQNAETATLRKARSLALESFECALSAVEPSRLLSAKIGLNGSCLRAENHFFDLSKFSHVYVVGGGKASENMAHALEKMLDTRITSGLVNVPYGSKKTTRIIELHEAGHPIPDESGVDGTRQMMALAEKADADDLLICLFSGGGSSLMPLPHDGVSLKEKQELSRTLLKSGAAISEINSVRKHLSAFKGGWLAKKAYPATILNIVLSDVIGDSLDSIASGPSVPDASTFTDAMNVLKRYSLWRSVSPSIRSLLLKGTKGLIQETPKSDDLAFEKVHSVIIGNNRTASLVALEYLKSKGLNTVLLSTSLEGEAEVVGALLGSLANEVEVSGNPVRKPAAIVIGGETTVTVEGKGQGGRNQELALSAALKLSNAENCVIASLSTDGVDGPTDAAGAIVDGCTLHRAGVLGLDAEQFLSNNDSYHFFAKIGDLMFTGATGTNVNDIAVVIVL